ncbi:protein YABBY 2-like isoform X1 [Zingiber officinale]|uniref:protein YABBY 2-like isoform X1 n=1 Tax=Zingiber officinale TaxID=94328 RepID=UPI001C4D3E9A|nr:protein YABBY 2-like isoform X1 [Zingiber officinale]
MSTQALPDQGICYVHCDFCNSVLVVSVPGNNLVSSSVVPVRCGHCSSLLSVNMEALLQTLPFHDHFQRDNMGSHQENRIESGSPSLSCTMPKGQEEILPAAHSSEKRERVPSAYNKFIKEEIQRIKANNPDISHREAFSAAAKNLSLQWAHLPHLH